MMNQTAPFERLGDRGGAMMTSLAQDATSYRLPRSGQRPLVFEGSELCMAMSYVPGTAFWYEVNVYRTTAGRFVVRLDMFTKSDVDRERHDAWECESFGEVLDLLEGYDAANDIRIDVEPDDPRLSLADLAAHALALRARAAEARRQYGGMIGELLHELDRS